MNQRQDIWVAKRHIERFSQEPNKSGLVNQLLDGHYGLDLYRPVYEVMDVNPPPARTANFAAKKIKPITKKDQAK